jgi:hypothetical protein
METKSREETSTKNGRSEVANRRDGLGLGLEVVKGETTGATVGRRRTVARLRLPEAKARRHGAAEEEQWLQRGG